MRAGLRLRAPPAEWSVSDGRPRRGRERRGGDDQAADGSWRSASRATGSGLGTCSKQGEQIFCSLSWAEELASPESLDEANEQLAATARFWRDWLSGARIPDHRWRDPIQRSALAIKGLTYMPTGATVAALTTSLPETPGGERNWDYRYTWLRDSTFTLQALHYLNLDWEAEEFMQFVADLEPNADGALQIMYGIDGRRDLTESDPRRSLRLRRREPGAGRQRRLRPAPERRLRRGAGLDPAAHAPQPAAAAAAVADRAVAGRVRDQRLARARPGHLGGPRRAAALRLLEARCAGWRWTARASSRRSAATPELKEMARDRRGDPGGHPRPRASATAASCASTTRPTRWTPRTCWRRSSASCRATTSGCARACCAIADDLTEDGFVLRYRTGETDDGLSGKEGSFLICSFWLVSALADRRRGAARPRPDGKAAAGRLAARAVRRGVRHRAPAGTWATSPRPSRISR